MTSLRLTSAHLLRNHDNTRRLSSSAYTGNGKQLNESGEEVVSLGNTRFLHKNVFLNKLRVNVIDIPGSLERRVSETKKRLVGLADLLLLHQPSRAFRAEPDTADKGHGGNEGGAELKTPCNSTHVHHDEICASSQENAKCRPNL
jgi:hypothetical protein